MSMPQPIRVAVVSSDRKHLEKVDHALNLPKSGMAPDYYFATTDDDIDQLANPQNYPYGFVHQWIALDSVAYDFCKEKYEEDRKNPRFSRGFYDEFLPIPILQIENEERTIEEMKKFTKEIEKAFNETS